MNSAKNEENSENRVYAQKREQVQKAEEIAKQALSMFYTKFEFQLRSNGITENHLINHFRLKDWVFQILSNRCELEEIEFCLKKWDKPYRPDSPAFFDFLKEQRTKREANKREKEANDPNLRIEELPVKRSSPHRAEAMRQIARMVGISIPLKSDY
jgi:hypothetical protein